MPFHPAPDHSANILRTPRAVRIGRNVRARGGADGCEWLRLHDLMVGALRRVVPGLANAHGHRPARVERADPVQRRAGALEGARDEVVEPRPLMHVGRVVQRDEGDFHVLVGIEWRRGRQPGRRFCSRSEDAPSDVHQIDDHSRVPSLSGLPAVLPERPVRVFFPCTGLGRQRRGFETFTLECAAALRHDPALEIRVFAGGPVSELPVHVLTNLPRDSRAARWLAMVHRRDSYFSEQLTFFLSFLPHLIRGAPDVVYFADLNLGNLCWHWRRLSGQRYRLLYYNGGLTTKPFTRADAVQQLTPAGLAEAQERGEDTSRQVVLPHGVNVPEHLPPRITGDARRPLGLPAHPLLVLSAALPPPPSH